MSKENQNFSDFGVKYKNFITKIHKNNWLAVAVSTTKLSQCDYEVFIYLILNTLKYNFVMNIFII